MSNLCWNRWARLRCYPHFPSFMHIKPRSGCHRLSSNLDWSWNWLAVGSGLPRNDFVWPIVSNLCSLLSLTVLNKGVSFFIDIFKKCKYIDNWYGFWYTKHPYADIQLPTFRSFPFCKKCNQMQSLKATKAQREVFRDGYFAAALSKLFSKWLNILISWKHNFQF